jgi:hypothetical protein
LPVSSLLPRQHRPGTYGTPATLPLWCRSASAQTGGTATNEWTGQNPRHSLHLLSEPNEAIGHAWLTDREFIVQADPPEAGTGFGYYRVDVASGASQRIVDLGLNPGGAISLGTALIHD